MAKIKTIDESGNYKQDIIKRLNRIEGQVKGIQRMIDDEKYCVDILTQIAAARAAISRVGGLVLENYTKTCMKKAIESGNRDQVMDELMSTIQKFLKFVD